MSSERAIGFERRRFQRAKAGINIGKRFFEIMQGGQCGKESLAPDGLDHKAVVFPINDGFFCVQFELPRDPDRLVTAVAEESDMTGGFHLGTFGT